MVRILIAANLLVYAFNLLYLYITGYDASYFLAVSDGSPWYTYITYLFCHANYKHLLFNMFALYGFGRVMEKHWGVLRFMVFYILTGLCAAWLHAAFQSSIPLVGASGAIFGLLVAVALVYPNQTITLFFPPLPIKLKYFAMLIAGIEIGLTMWGVDGDMLAHYAHIGGALSGLFLTLIMMKR